ncbi:retron system putative HNH endonuclease [Cardiobacterium valvarum]|uniref:TIGR02646 family protein n=1 Tax=Cardiobacterium valvarum F0432 TaxID=797473 RepID=G9ZJC2_9GAMM|nr:retron system putative HNH endonuclease [Cardiobacterium valvarum]EHM50263.1 TIGR02646 family protein [Cardiobacterium valvarum F0432]
MKYIVKQCEPVFFTTWKAQANANWQPEYSNMPTDIKQQLKDALLDEQGWICCYCEQEITPDDSHIEHFRPQSDPNCDPLDYSNLLGSCQKQRRKGEPLHCGSLKADWFDRNLLISPLNPSCESRFVFLGNGEIQAKDANDQAAKETIQRLGLNIPKLIEMRKKVIEVFLDELLTDVEVANLVSTYLVKKAKKYSPFWSTIHYLFS